MVATKSPNNSSNRYVPEYNNKVTYGESYVIPHLMKRKGGTSHTNNTTGIIRVHRA